MYRQCSNLHGKFGQIEIILETRNPGLRNSVTSLHTYFTIRFIKSLEEEFKLYQKVFGKTFLASKVGEYFIELKEFTNPGRTSAR